MIFPFVLEQSFSVFWLSLGEFYFLTLALALALAIIIAIYHLFL